jgi:hypothetical protein
MCKEHEKLNLEFSKSSLGKLASQMRDLPGAKVLVGQSEFI